MLEALVVTSMLVLLWSALLFASRIHAKKLTARGEARAAVWTHALRACEGGAAQRVGSDGANLDAVTTDGEAGADATLNEEGEQLVTEARSSPEGGSLEFGESWGIAESSSAQDGESFLSFSIGSIQSRMQVQCDEKPRGADPRSVLEFLWDLRTTANL
jgi:hypothetical protein